MGDQAVRDALNTLSGLICAIVNSMGQGNFTLGKRQGESGIWL